MEICIAWCLFPQLENLSKMETAKLAGENIAPLESHNFILFLFSMFLLGS